MNAIRVLLKDRKASQRGSVLSGVLFMTAFIAIISGALMTELSTNFLLSHNLLTRLTNQATVNSAIESSLNQLQATPLNAGCPTLQPVNLNNSWAVPAYTSCWPTFRERQYPPIASSSAFKVDGSHSLIPRAGLDLYVVGDSGGKVYQFTFGSQIPNWTWQLPGRVSGRPVSVPDIGGNSNDVATLVPLATQSDSLSACQAGGCVAFLGQDGTFPPDVLCYMGANGAVTAAAAMGVNNPTIAFFGDQAGVVFAYSATENGNCTLQARTPSAGQPVVAGPVVFGGPVTATSRTDEIYAVTSDSTSSWLRRYIYAVKNGSATLAQASALQLVASNAVGLAVDGNSLPARVAITFAGGQVTLVQIQSGYGMQLLANGQIPAGIADAPYWCCGGSPSVVGVAQTNALYLLDATQNLRVAASYAVGTTISGSPAADSAGDWFFGTDNGNVYEVPAIQSSPTLVTFGSGQLGQVRSSVQLGACSAGICLYMGSLNGNAYIVPLDARNAVLTACISNAPPACSGATPRLTAQIEVGAAGKPNTVHVQGWAYYSS